MPSVFRPGIGGFRLTHKSAPSSELSKMEANSTESWKAFSAQTMLNGSLCASVQSAPTKSMRKSPPFDVPVEVAGARKHSSISSDVETVYNNNAGDFALLCQRAEVNPKLVVIGAGYMGGALVKGLMSKGLFAAKDIIVTATCEKTLASYRNIYVNCSTNNADALREASDGICVLAVQPAALHIVASQCSKEMRNMRMIISVLAGVPCDAITKAFSLSQSAVGGPILIRAMPNTPTLMGQGATAYLCDPHATPLHSLIVERLFRTVGTCDRVHTERQMDVVCGLSGSGCAYLYIVIDAMADGAVRMGLPRILATRLAAQTVMGAAKSVLRTHENPGSLKAAVCTPGGSSMAGIYELERHGVRSAFMDAVEAATKRAAEMGKELTEYCFDR